MTQARDPLTPDPNIKLVAVFRTGNAAVAAVARSLLEDAGIEYELRGEALRDLGGWDLPGTFTKPLGPAVFVVRHRDADEAKRLLAPSSRTSGRELARTKANVRLLLRPRKSF